MHALPKYNAFISRVRRAASLVTIQPTVMPHPPQGLDMPDTLMPRSYTSAIAGSRSAGSCSKCRYTWWQDGKGTGRVGRRPRRGSDQHAAGGKLQFAWAGR